MEWYQKLGYKKNPLSTDPKDNHDKLINMDAIAEEVLYRIESGSMLVVEGNKGTGKTSLLMIAAKKFGGHRNVAYVDCKILDKNLNITNVLQDRYGLMGRLLNKKPTKMILLLDNVQSLSKKNTERLKYYFDQDYLKAIVFTTERYTRSNFSDSLMDRIGKRVVKIPVLEDYDALELIRKRIGEDELLSEQLIKKLFKDSESSPKLLLENCEKVADAASKKSRKKAQENDLKVLKNE